MAMILFATETVKTSQGWFEPGHLMPSQDLPTDEIYALLEAKQAGACQHDSPLAAVVHEARVHPNKHHASETLKTALDTVSDESPSNAQPEQTPVPTLEEYVAAGYKAENYERFMGRETGLPPDEPPPADPETTATNNETKSVDPETDANPASS